MTAKQVQLAFYNCTLQYCLSKSSQWCAFLDCNSAAVPSERRCRALGSSGGSGSFLLLSWGCDLWSGPARTFYSKSGSSGKPEAIRPAKRRRSFLPSAVERARSHSTKRLNHCLAKPTCLAAGQTSAISRCGSARLVCKADLFFFFPVIAIAFRSTFFSRELLFRFVPHPFEQQEDLANFHACVGNNDRTVALQYLKAHNWDLMVR
jgi:hypothetical protein